MSIISRSAPKRSEPVELSNGDRMSRVEFHRLYENAPRNFKAELIGGVVHVASPLRVAHGNHHGHLAMLFSAYEFNTPGVEMGDNVTVILGDQSEPQPDLYLRVLPEYGGQSATSTDDYVDGAPELVAEVAHSSRSIDLHAKREDYARNGVREYLVMSLSDARLRWFDLASNCELSADTDSVIRVRSFPGLWIDAQALFSRDFRKLMAIFQQGIDDPAHAAFVEQLANSRRTK
jgi:Uma2 family endonuclease